MCATCESGAYNDHLKGFLPSLPSLQKQRFRLKQAKLQKVFLALKRYTAGDNISNILDRGSSEGFGCSVNTRLLPAAGA